MKEKYIQILMGLVALHSIAVGIGLLVLPFEYLAFFGFPNYPDNFFQAQGAVFHFVMSAAYIIAAINPKKYHVLLLFSFIAKMIATVFLILYFLVISQIITVLISGIFDCILGVVIFYAYLQYSLNSHQNT